jgi:lipopolysaccharide export system protein LptC
MLMVSNYTRFVALSKRFLWVLVFGMLALVVWIASYNTGENGARIVFSNVPKSGILQNIMSKPHYQGVDIHGHPYTVIADKAMQVDKDRVNLENIRADMVLGNGSWIALNAGAGTLNLQTKQLELTSGVDMFYDDGYEFRTDHAHIDIHKATAYGDAPVEGQGRLGTLQAVGFSVGERGETIHFNGSVKMVLYRQ